MTYNHKDIVNKETYCVSWTVKMSHYVDATNHIEAKEIADDMGDINANTEVTPKRVKKVIYEVIEKHE